jgi:hypothetical protein
VVTLDLEPIVLEAADRIGLRDQVADNLPASVGRIEILRSDELDTAQSVAQLLKVLAWVLPILALLVFALAVWLSRDRRRTVRRIGLALAVVGVVGLVAVGVVGNYIVEELVTETQNEAAASSAWDILTELLRRSFWSMIPIGILLVVASWLASPEHQATAARRYLAPALSARIWPYLALAIVAVILLLTGPVSDFSRYFVVAVLVALGALWIELTRRQTIREFPDARSEDMLDELRTKVSGLWDTSRKPAPVQAPSAVATGSDITAKLAALSELHASAKLTDEEYAAAKARVLAGE